MSTRISYTLKITLTLVRPTIWRRILVPTDIRLPRLHAVIQIITGASGSGQYFFIDSQKTVYANPTWDDLPGLKPGRDVKLERLLSRPGDRLAYYCGDDDEWEHAIELLKITEAVGRTSRVTCVAGSRRHLGEYECHGRVFPLSAVNRALQRVRV
jgi:hypothetical protein